MSDILPSFPFGWALNKFSQPHWRKDPEPPQPEGPLLEERPQPLSDIFWEGAQAGALGGPVGGVGTRVLPEYGDWVEELGQRPVVFRGIPGSGGLPVKDPLSVTSGVGYPGHGNVAFGSTNPVLAATYAGQDPGDAVYPMRLNPDELHSFPSPRARDAMLSGRWERATSGLAPGEAILAKGVVDPGWSLPPTGHGVIGLTQHTPSDQYAWTRGVASPAGRPLSKDDVDDVIRAAASRIGESDPMRPPEGPAWGRTIDEDELARAAQARRMFGEVAMDPRFRPSLKEKVGGFLRGRAKGALRGAVNPFSILLDATLGSTAGGLGAVAGYKSGEPDSQARFIPPPSIQEELQGPDAYTGKVPTGPYTEGQVRRATVRAAAKKEDPNFFTRMELIDRIDEANRRFGEGTVPINTPLEVLEQMFPDVMQNWVWGE